MRSFNAVGGSQGGRPTTPAASNCPISSRPIFTIIPKRRRTRWSSLKSAATTCAILWPVLRLMNVIRKIIFNKAFENIDHQIWELSEKAHGIFLIANVPALGETPIIKVLDQFFPGTVAGVDILTD